MSQRFCLRWNNHQSNMLSVFDQLLHDESFVDVTLAVDGQLLRAHKMVLSACSPLFQALFINHPDKHPIVILKDVPYSDMRCLLDFMYRGEVSVDQDRLTAFLKVAESLRIKGLTEVNEEKCDIPSITNNLLSSIPVSHSTPVAQPPPHLHRIQMPQVGQKRTMPPLVASNPLLGSALTAPKRKRGRPRKLSGGSDDHHMRDSSPQDLDGDDLEYEGRGNTGSSESMHGSPPPQDMMEMRMDYGQKHNSRSTLDETSSLDDSQSPLKDKVSQQRWTSKDDSEPTPGTSTQETGQAQLRIGSNGSSASSGKGSGSGSGNNTNTATNGNPPNIGNGIGLANSENLPPGLGEMPFGGGFFISSSRIPVSMDDMGSSEHEGDIEEVEENEEDAINYSRNSYNNMEPKNLVKREMVDKRKPSRPRKLPEQLTISSFANNCADIKLFPAPSSESDVSHSDYDSYVSMMEHPNSSFETGDYDQHEGNEKVIPLDVKLEVKEGGRSVRQFCVREAGNLFRCRMCSRTYTHISNFCRHFITTHRGVKQEVPCPICGKMFTRKDNMVTHTKMVHGCTRLDKGIPQPQ